MLHTNFTNKFSSESATDLLFGKVGKKFRFYTILFFKNIFVEKKTFWTISNVFVSNVFLTLAQNRSYWPLISETDCILYWKIFD